MLERSSNSYGEFFLVLVECFLLMVLKLSQILLWFWDNELIHYYLLGHDLALLSKFSSFGFDCPSLKDVIDNTWCGAFVLGHLIALILLDA